MDLRKLIAAREKNEKLIEAAHSKLENFERGETNVIVLGDYTDNDVFIIETFFRWGRITKNGRENFDTVCIMLKD